MSEAESESFKAHEARAALRARKRLDAFNASLPYGYRRFDMEKAANPGLSADIFKRYKVWEDDDSDDPGSGFGFTPPTGILAFGSPRAGKTHTLVEAARRRITSGYEYADARFISAVAWGAEASRRAKECELDGWVERTLRFAWEDYVDCGYLIIDDLDKLRFSPSVQSTLFYLIETAVTNEVALLVTTNATASELCKKFDPSLGPAIVARLVEHCTPINFDIKLPV